MIPNISQFSFGHTNETTSEGCVPKIVVKNRMVPAREYSTTFGSSPQFWVPVFSLRPHTHSAVSESPE